MGSPDMTDWSPCLESHTGISDIQWFHAVFVLVWQVKGRAGQPLAVQDVRQILVLLGFFCGGSGAISWLEWDYGERLAISLLVVNGRCSSGTSISETKHLAMGSAVDRRRKDSFAPHLA